VHLYVGGDTRNNGGTMTENTSPNDPVFFLHHANIDRIWAQWERIHGSTYLPTSGFRQGQNLDDRMWPWFEQRPADVLGRAGLGYVYESETRATPRQQLVAVSPPCGGPAPGTIRPSAAHTESMPGSAP
jgi:tyrosinase